MTKAMGLEAAEIARAVDGLVDSSEPTRETLAEILARAAFSVITEPGDRFAGWLLNRYPAVDIIECLQQGYQFEELLDSQARVALFEKFGDLATLFAAAKERWQPRFAFKTVLAALDAARHLRAQLITPLSPNWPSGLGLLDEAAPHCLWFKGDSRLFALSARSISIVGSRLATSYGEYVTTEVVSESVSNSLAVISGGAYGIDAIAHRATLAVDGFTIAVLAGGIDRLYPAGNFELLQKIGEQNLLITEQAPGSSPTKWRFLQRNRIIAALGSATVVVEAGIRSGALSTANHANQIGRKVGAFPGRIDSPQSAGCHELIRGSGAVLLGSAAQAIDLATDSAEVLEPFAQGLGQLETRLLDALTTKPQRLERLAVKAGLTSHELTIALGQLQLQGLVQEQLNGWVKASKV